MGGRRRRHGGGARAPRRGRRTSRDIARRAADQDARRRRCHVLGLRPPVGGRRSSHRASRGDHARAVDAECPNSHQRGVAHRRGRTARRRLFRSGGQPRRPPAVIGIGRPDPVLGRDGRTRDRLAARRRRARRSWDAATAQPRASGARVRASSGNRRRPSSRCATRRARRAPRAPRSTHRSRAVRRPRQRARTASRRVAGSARRRDGRDADRGRTGRGQDTSGR